MNEDRQPGPTSTPCRYCGSDEQRRNLKELREQAATFQVVVACASCGSAFAALSRN